MPYKVFTQGEEALASDVNTLLMGQVVARFPNAATRTTGLASPAVNQLSMLDTRPGIVSYWNGTVWADVAPFIQSGVNSVTSNASGDINIVFPTPFAAAPVVVTSPGSTPGNGAIVFIQPYNLTAADMTLRATNYTGLVPNTGFSVRWIAIGTRP